MEQKIPAVQPGDVFFREIIRSGMPTWCHGYDFKSRFWQDITEPARKYHVAAGTYTPTVQLSRELITRMRKTQVCCCHARTAEHSTELTARVHKYTHVAAAT